MTIMNLVDNLPGPLGVQKSQSRNMGSALRSQPTVLTSQWTGEVDTLSEPHSPLV